MRWRYSINEVSAGHFTCEAIREDGRSISLDGTDDVIPQALHDTYMIELSLGVYPGSASYEITRSFLSRWTGVFHTGMMGSWTVSDPATSRRVDYDGRDMYLMVSRDSSGYSWQGGIAELSKARCHYYRELSSL